MGRIKKIALLTDGVFPLVIGGMQKHSFFLLQYLLKQDIQVLLIHPGGNGRLKDHLNAQLLPFLDEQIISFPEKGILPGSYLRRSFAYARKAAALVKSEGNIDFIYAQGFTGWSLVDEKKRGAQLPPIGVNFHGLEMFQPSSGLKQKWIQKYFQGPVRFILQHADVAYSLGPRLTELIHKEAPSAKVTEIPIGLEKNWAITQALDKGSSPKKIVFIGRLEYRKGLHILFSLLKDHPHHELEFHFIGGVEQPKDIDGENLHFHGEIRDEASIKEILDGAHALLIPSLSEGMPTVILEAMARGLPILASDVGAVNELVDDSNGILFKSGSELEIHSALSDFSGWSEEVWKEKSQASLRRFLEGFIWEKVIVRTLHEMEKNLS